MSEDKIARNKDLPVARRGLTEVHKYYCKHAAETGTLDAFHLATAYETVLFDLYRRNIASAPRAKKRQKRGKK